MSGPVKGILLQPETVFRGKALSYQLSLQGSTQDSVTWDFRMQWDVQHVAEANLLFHSYGYHTGTWYDPELVDAFFLQVPLTTYKNFFLKWRQGELQRTPSRGWYNIKSNVGCAALPSTLRRAFMKSTQKRCNWGDLSVNRDKDGIQRERRTGYSHCDGGRGRKRESEMVRELRTLTIFMGMQGPKPSVSSLPKLCS